ncbi:DNA-binding MarR family transcriptional regulator [Leifsonia sp. AK011]|uniref:MarR family winged helix-turn-helix transcriptional regulator n=1 Tax=Leifsonia sp. AK011 TaxID=2723075 RepID=UPI00183A3B7B|nr:MarR family transcriptional regulator [Leifsonia sp. AK011]NYF08987.1 DNA-binding MarR family transcriptional regulator [Leifsonia sp. AK011]
MSDRAASIAAWEALFRAQVSVLRQLNAEFPTDEISFTEYDVLFNLSRQPDRQLRIRDLNKHLLLSQPSVSRLVDRLASKGYVSKESDPGDGRGTVARLTDSGFELFRRVAVQHADSIQRRVGSALSVDELHTLTKICDKLRLETQPHE